MAASKCLAPVAQHLGRGGGHRKGAADQILDRYLMALRYFDLFRLTESRAAEPFDEIDVIAGLIGVGRPGPADLVEFAAPILRRRAIRSGAADGDPAVRGRQFDPERRGLIAVEPMQRAADGHGFKVADVGGQFLDSCLDQIEMDPGTRRFDPRRLQHLRLDVDAHAAFHVRREAHGQRTRPASDVDQPARNAGGNAFAPRHLAKKTVG